MSARTYAKFISDTEIDRNLPRRATWQGQTVVGDITTTPGLPESLGFLPLEETPEPSEPAPVGSHYKPRYALDDAEEPTAITQTWVAVEDPPAPPRTFSKYKLKLAIAQAGLLSQFTALLAQVEVAPGYMGDEAFRDASTLDEDHPKFKEGVAAVKQTFGLTDEQIEAILAASVAE